MIQPVRLISYTSNRKAKIRATSLKVTLLVPMPASVSPEVYQPFDYDSLDRDTAIFLRQREDALSLRLELRDKLDIEIGQILVEIRARLGYGLFKAWIEAKYYASRTKAYGQINVYEVFGSYPNFGNLPIDKKAAELLAERSTPEAARTEALTLAEAGGLITRSTALALRKKYTTPPPEQQPPSKTESQTTPVSSPKPTSTTSTPTASNSKKPEIVAIRSKQPPTESVETTPVMTKGAATVTLVPNANLSGSWWQLGKHLLFCGDPNSSDFLSRLSEVQLLFAFPPDRSWLPKLEADIRIIRADYLLPIQNPTQIEQTLEADILRYSHLRDIVVSCFLPSLDILSAINRLGRHGVIAEPDPKRYNALIADWKKAGINVERVS